MHKKIRSFPWSRTTDRRVHGRCCGQGPGAPDKPGSLSSLYKRCLRGPKSRRPPYGGNQALGGSRHLWRREATSHKDWARRQAPTTSSHLSQAFLRGDAFSSLTHLSFFKSHCSISCQERSVKIWLYTHLFQFWIESVLLHILEYFSSDAFIIIWFPDEEHSTMTQTPFISGNARQMEAYFLWYEHTLLQGLTLNICMIYLFLPFTFKLLSMSSYSKLVSCRQHMVGTWFSSILTISASDLQCVDR